MWPTNYCNVFQRQRKMKNIGIVRKTPYQLSSVMNH